MLNNLKKKIWDDIPKLRPQLGEANHYSQLTHNITIN